MVGDWIDFVPQIKAALFKHVQQIRDGLAPLKPLLQFLGALGAHRQAGGEVVAGVLVLICAVAEVGQRHHQQVLGDSAHLIMIIKRSTLTVLKVMPFAFIPDTKL